MCVVNGVIYADRAMRNPVGRWKEKGREEQQEEERERERKKIDRLAKRAPRDYYKHSD